MKGYSLCCNEWALDKDIKNELGLLLIISSLCAKKGFCYASNEYLAKIFGEDTSTTSKKIKKLEKKKYIQIVYKKRGFQVVARELRLAKMPTDHCQKYQSSIGENANGTIGENAKENIISNNIINIKKESKKEGKTYNDILADCNLSDRLTKTIMDFVAMRNMIKKPMTNRGLELLIKHLQEMSKNENEQIEILEQSIMNNWQGLYPLKKDTNEVEESSYERTKRLYEGYMERIT